MAEAASVRVRALLAVLAAMTSAGLAISLLSLPTRTSDLANQVMANLPQSGADHPVTAVLLNFRSYDTMLELGVLFLVVIGVWSLGPVEPDPAALAPTGPVLATASRTLYPVLLLVAGYLLWVGASAPGGAFQAGAILAAGVVLAMLTGWRAPIGLRPAIEGSLIFGLAAFVCVAGTTLTYSGVLLALPPELAKGTILGIEVAATIAIGFALAAVYLGGSPGRWYRGGSD